MVVSIDSGCVPEHTSGTEPCLLELTYFEGWVQGKSDQSRTESLSSIQ